jgi:hypothetical protein
VSQHVSGELLHCGDRRRLFGPSDHETERHYPTMSEEELIASRRKIAAMTSVDAIHFMWAAPHLFLIATRLLHAWGFPYRTHIVWRKPRAGLGQYLRSQHECLLIGRGGAMPTPFESDRVSSVIDAPLGPHSVKPDIFAELIEAWYPLPLAALSFSAAASLVLAGPPGATRSKRRPREPETFDDSERTLPMIAKESDMDHPAQSEIEARGAFGELVEALEKGARGNVGGNGTGDGNGGNGETAATATATTWAARSAAGS